MRSVFKTLDIIEPIGEKVVTLPRGAQIFDIHKGQGLYGTSFTICYHYNEDEIAFEKLGLHLVKEGEVIDNREKLRYIGKYSMKFSNGLIFVFLRVAP